MIFSNIIYKIASGKNITTHTLSSGFLEIYLFNTYMQKFLFSINPPSSSLSLLNVNYDYIKKLSNDLYVVGYDNNISVVNGL